MSISVLIVDDHQVVRQGLRRMLADVPDFTVIGEAGSAVEALQQANRHCPDVALVDIRLLPGANGIALTKELRRQHSSLKVIILTTYYDEQFLYKGLEAGAHAYVLKTTRCEDLVETIRAVNRGERRLDKELVPSLLNQFEVLAKRESMRSQPLIEEEVEILRLMAEGLTKREIAQQMHYSEVTVKRKCHEIYYKLSAKSQAQAVALAVRSGLM